MSLSLLLASAIAITNVTVIDTAAGQSLRDRTVVIEGNRVASITADAAPKGATIVDGRGKFLIPGLWDMHVHISWTRPSALPVLVATGVTGVRDLASNFTEIESWRTRIESGDLAGPRIFRVGPILNGKSFNKYQMVPGNPENTRGVARLLKFLEVDFIKVHRRFERESYFALLDEAKKLGIDVVGHIPMSVTPEEAVNGGQATIEHVVTLFEGTFSAALGDRNFSEAMREWRAKSGDALFARFVANNTAFDPTLIAYRPEEMPQSLNRYVARSMLDEGAKRKKPTSEETAKGQQMFAEFKEVVRQANRAGVLIVTGSDIAAERVPGFTLHEELALLVECGLTPMQTLQAATVNSAKAMKKKDVGVIAPGAFADVVLLDADPLIDIHNTLRIGAVIANGRLFRRADLDALLREAVAQAAKN